VVVVAAVLSFWLAAWMVLVQPFVGRRRYRRLLEKVHRDPAARLQHYRRGLAFEWGGAAFVALLALLAHSRLESLWPAGTDPDAGGQVPGLVVAVAVITAVYRFGGAVTRRALAVQLRPVAALLPRTPVERRAFAGLAVTAGICEEVLYRGFGLAALRWADPDLGTAALIALTGGAFGLAHLYQGAMGVIVTGALGGYFAWLTIATGTLVHVIVLHVLLDVRILALPLDGVPLPGDPGGHPSRGQPRA
jgi:membrane protease YdiL (CAAX protease family)